MARKTFVGMYQEHDSKIQTHFRRSTTLRRLYTHAVIPYYTTRIKHLPSAEHHGLTMPIAIPCEPYYGRPQFCSSLALAQKKLKPGWILVEVHEEIR